MQADTAIIIGGGMTGLAAGMASGLPIYEAEDNPGGICSSYYIRPGENKRLSSKSPDGGVYRFELGGGHWIFGGDPLVLEFIRGLVPVKSYSRRSSIYLPEQNLYIPYPIQNNLRYLNARTAARVLHEMAQGMKFSLPPRTMADWLEASFGPTLGEIFFYPFHDRYTAGLWREIAPQDGFKSPVNFSLAAQGALLQALPVGYNITFVYPQEGLDGLARRMAENCNIHYGKRVVKINAEEQNVYFEDGSLAGYNKLLTTLPIDRMLEVTCLKVSETTDPSTSVLVLNIGAIRGEKCPQDHWLYIPRSKAGFHRVGFYSHVDESFLPTTNGSVPDRVSIYVEKAFPGGQKPKDPEIQQLSKAIVRELQEWGWIEYTEVTDPTWIDTAYTWSWPASHWRQQAIQKLEIHNIYPVGRYGRWAFQGIADSIRDGLMAGAVFKGVGIG